MVKLEVRSKNEKGFRRAGRFWPSDPVEVEVDEGVARQLMMEPALFVRHVGGTKPADPAPVDVKPEPFASGLEDGMRPVPSDLNEGKPVDEGMMPRRRPATTTTTVVEKPSFVADDGKGGGPLTLDEKPSKG